MDAGRQFLCFRNLVRINFGRKKGLMVYLEVSAVPGRKQA
jgi:hypothetical protein